MKNDPRVVRAWTLYDWANSVHSLVIVSSIFPVYFSATALNASGGPVIDFLGIQIKNSVLFSYTVSAAMLLVACISPFSTALADYSGKKTVYEVFLLYGFAGLWRCFISSPVIPSRLRCFALPGAWSAGQAVSFSTTPICPTSSPRISLTG